jgi:plastocyanin
MNTLRVRPRALAALVAAALLLPGTATLAQEPVVVRITDTLLSAQLEVAPGTTVTWQNEDDERHRVRSREGPEEFDSGNLEPGESFTFTFTLPGSYPYLDEREDDDAAYFGTIVVSGDGGTAAPADSAAVSIIDESFRPPTVSVFVGATVTWSHDDGDDQHTVTSVDGAFDSGILVGGQTFSQTFAEPGDHQYICAVHPDMRGTVSVVADPAVPASPASSPSASASASASAAASASPSASVPASPGASADSGSAPQVTMGGLAFHPATVEVAVGESVDWLNDDAVPHTVTANDGSFNSGLLNAGDGFSNTFETPGTFDYFCAIHPQMRATVTVTE